MSIPPSIVQICILITSMNLAASEKKDIEGKKCLFLGREPILLRLPADFSVGDSIYRGKREQLKGRERDK